MHNYTLNNLLTNYQFNPDASDEEIMLIALESKDLAFDIYSDTMNYIIRYSNAMESSRSKTVEMAFHLN